MDAGPVKDRKKLAEFDKWALAHKDHIYTACLYLTRSRDDAEDLFQETYLRAFRFFHQFAIGTNCRAWLLTIMHNAFKNRYAKRSYSVRHVEYDAAAYEYESKLLADGETRRDDPAEVVLSHVLDSEIAEALQAIPEQYRTVLLLVDLEELSYEEAAAVLGRPLGTVRSRLSRARRLLHVALTDYARERGYLKRARKTLQQAGKTETNP